MLAGLLNRWSHSPPVLFEAIHIHPTPLSRVPLSPRRDFRQAFVRHHTTEAKARVERREAMLEAKRARGAQSAAFKHPDMAETRQPPTAPPTTAGLGSMVREEVPAPATTSAVQHTTPPTRPLTDAEKFEARLAAVREDAETRHTAQLEQQQYAAGVAGVAEAKGEELESAVGGMMQYANRRRERRDEKPIDVDKLPFWAQKHFKGARTPSPGDGGKVAETPPKSTVQPPTSASRSRQEAYLQMMAAQRALEEYKMDSHQELQDLQEKSARGESKPTALETLQKVTDAETAQLEHVLQVKTQAFNEIAGDGATVPAAASGSSGGDRHQTSPRSAGKRGKSDFEKAFERHSEG